MVKEKSIRVRIEPTMELNGLQDKLVNHHHFMAGILIYFSPLQSY